MNYYDENGKEFFDSTVDTDMSPHYEEFLKMIPQEGCILDAGCGSGRDTKKFKSLNYNVVAIDGSEKMCELASKYASINVKHLQFQDIEFEDCFDGIWASASLLHVPSTEIEDVVNRLKRSLKDTGVLYASFKYGNFEGERNGRYFNDLDESSSEELFERMDFKIIKTWITHDGRKGREDERWVNILVKKKTHINNHDNHNLNITSKRK